MCPFGSKLCSLLLADVNFGMHTEAERQLIQEFASGWAEKLARGELDFRKTGMRMALAAATTTNAVLGRPPAPRSRSQMIDELRAKAESLALLKTEQQILKGWSDDQQTGSVARAEKALELASSFDLFIMGGEAKRMDVQERFAGLAAEAFFDFARRECTMKGHGMEGLARAIGIVLGEISLEEVVFG